MTISWRFPKTDGGVEHGGNDAGMDTFASDAVSKTVREILQNSLDHKDPGYDKVIVEFKLSNLPGTCFDSDVLIEHFKSCVDEMAKLRQNDAKVSYERAVEMLKNPTVPCLSITDNNTTGLIDHHWGHLIFVEGAGKVEGGGVQKQEASDLVNSHHLTSPQFQLSYTPHAI